MSRIVDVSVVIPCYNAETTIETCINSVLNQTVIVHEIIVVDDGSSDSSIGMLRDISEKVGLKGIRFLLDTQVNSGPSTARNKGVLLASATWIAFLDSDDYWFPTKLEKQLEVLAADPEIALCGCGYKTSKFHLEDNLVNSISFNRLCKSNFFSTPSVVVKRDIIGEFRFNEHQKYSEDYRAWLHICAEYKCVYLNEVLCDNIENKKVYGDKGLSSKLWKMEVGELSNFMFLCKRGYISRAELIVLGLYSYLKFIRRLLLSSYRS